MLHPKRPRCSTRFPTSKQHSNIFIYGPSSWSQPSFTSAASTNKAHFLAALKREAQGPKCSFIQQSTTLQEAFIQKPTPRSSPFIFTHPSSRGAACLTQALTRTTPTHTSTFTTASNIFTGQPVKQQASEKTAHAETHPAANESHKSYFAAAHMKTHVTFEEGHRPLGIFLGLLAAATYILRKNICLRGENQPTDTHTSLSWRRRSAERLPHFSVFHSFV